MPRSLLRVYSLTDQLLPSPRSGYLNHDASDSPPSETVSSARRFASLHQKPSYKLPTPYAPESSSPTLLVPLSPCLLLRVCPCLLISPSLCPRLSPCLLFRLANTPSRAYRDANHHQDLLRRPGLRRRGCCAVLRSEPISG